MGDEEVDGQLPNTQPYQTIVEGPIGRVYCEGYLRGLRKPSGNVITAEWNLQQTRNSYQDYFRFKRRLKMAASHMALVIRVEGPISVQCSFGS